MQTLSRHLLLCENYISQPATFWRRDLWQQAGGLSTDYRAAFDYDLWIRLAACSRALPIHQVLASFRRHDTSISARQFERQFQEELASAVRAGQPLHRLVHRFNCWKILCVYRLLSRRRGGGNAPPCSR